MKKTTIYFVRHGEVYNPKKVLYGRLPKFPLSDEGRKHIKHLAQKLKNQGISYIYTSPMKRTRETAQIIGNMLHLTAHLSLYLVETHDVYSGISTQKFQKEIEPHLYSPKNVHMGQESIESQAKRMLKFIDKVKKLHRGEKIIAVGHGDPIMIIRAYLSGKKFTYRYKKEHYIKKGDYFILEINAGYKWTK